MSKSQKKNQKRSGKKPQGGGGFEIEENITGGPGVSKKDPVQELREQLAQAKIDKVEFLEGGRMGLCTCVLGQGS